MTLFNLNSIKLYLNYRFGYNYRFYPLKILIEPTNACNLDCIMCPRRKMKREVGFMDFTVFKKIIDESKDFVQEWQFSLMGEPMLHPNIFEMIEYAHSKGKYTCLFSNATLLDEKRVCMLLQCGLDRISLTLDGATKETYEKIRRKANYETTVNGIIMLVEYRKEMKSKKPEIILQITEMAENMVEIPEFIKKFGSLPIDKLQIRPFDTWGGDEEIIQHSPSMKKTKKNKKMQCTQLWTTMVITWDGKVIPCCRDYDASVVLGDVMKNNLLIEIWNGEQIKKFRESHPSSFLCRNCIEWDKERNLKDHILPFIKRHFISFKNRR